jgi:hypothetical protein
MILFFDSTKHIIGFSLAKKLNLLLNVPFQKIIEILSFDANKKNLAEIKN